MLKKESTANRVLANVLEILIHRFNIIGYHLLINFLENPEKESTCRRIANINPSLQYYWISLASKFSGKPRKKTDRKKKEKVFVKVIAML